METILDHNITEQELMALLGSNEASRTFLESFSQDTNYWAIYLLYKMRGDEQTANLYYEKIEDNNQDLTVPLNHINP